MAASPRVPAPGSLGLRALNWVTAAHVWSYRRSGGRVGGTLKGAPVLLLDHVGRRSGTRRTTPLLYLADGADVVIVGSAGGREAAPAWWLNLRDAPETTVQVGSERRPVRARLASGEERERLWGRLVEMFPDYEDYRRRTSREIPVVVLSPRS